MNDNSTFQPIGLTAARLVDKLRQTNELTVMSHGSSSKNSGSLFLATESPETLSLSVNSDFCVPTIPVAGSPINSLQAGCGPRLTIEGVLAACGFSEVDEAIIGFHAINMINKFRGPFPMNKEPSEAMSKVADAIDTNDAISQAQGAGAASSEAGISGFAPDKLAGIRRVIQEFADSFRRHRVVKLAHASPAAKKEHEESKRNADTNSTGERYSESQGDNVDKSLNPLRAVS